jgi:hypothetical protein
MTTKDAQLIEMERLMRSAPEPGGLEGATMGEGVAVTNTTVESAGYVTMWNTDTREPSVFNMNSIRTKLRETFPVNYETIAMRGKPAWTATEPSTKPWRGTAVCPLHDSRPQRAAYDLEGYPKCTREHLPNDMEAQEHLKKKHPATWRQMNEARAEVERVAQVEDRVINRQILAKLAGVELDEPTLETPWFDSGVPSVENVIIRPSHLVRIEDHPHRYGKTVGSPCKVKGCVEVRKVAFKTRRKNHGG